jgi:hypothetical protein
MIVVLGSYRINPDSRAEFIAGMDGFTQYDIAGSKKLL